MYDALTHSWEFTCPSRDSSTWVALSDFRVVDRLPGPQTPAVYRVRWTCTDCANDHVSLVAQNELDLEPLSGSTTAVFYDLLTGSRELAATPLARNSSDEIRRGRWPWTFYCWPERAMRPAVPSSVQVVAPVQHVRGARHGVLVECMTCSRHTVNLVSREHLDVPFYADDRMHVVESLMASESLTPEESLRHALAHGVPHMMRY